ncbi:hypothetical protein QAD02_000764 [Eretmocerus hayati]|uniref:Uncharacterized protein n=1 Tax=Eretmocerus hayati TaxID=131215 RepID=A0ACC2NE74_9HYME|nr:hypothetical protein QAD02_000764 [Eretmocerus hayati]
MVQWRSTGHGRNYGNEKRSPRRKKTRSSQHQGLHPRMPTNVLHANQLSSVTTDVVTDTSTRIFSAHAARRCVSPTAEGHDCLTVTPRVDKVRVRAFPRNWTVSAPGGYHPSPSAAPESSVSEDDLESSISPPKRNYREPSEASTEPDPLHPQGSGLRSLLTPAPCLEPDASVQLPSITVKASTSTASDVATSLLISGSADEPLQAEFPSCQARTLTSSLPRMRCVPYASFHPRWGCCERTVSDAATKTGPSELTPHQPIQDSCEPSLPRPTTGLRKGAEQPMHRYHPQSLICMYIDQDNDEP